LGSIKGLVSFCVPGVEGRQGIFMPEMLDGQSLLFIGETNLLFEKAISKSGLNSRLCLRAKIHAGRTRPVYRCQAHGAGFATTIDFAVGQLEAANYLACRTDSDDFGVCRRI